ncbi:MAG: NUDIX domain-containing protein [Mesorhizobium sp.]
MARTSARILAYRRKGPRPETLLGHPGGAFWSRRDEGAWSILKGEHEESGNPEAAARREFTDESGWTLAVPLELFGKIRQSELEEHMAKRRPSCFQRCASGPRAGSTSRARHSDTSTTTKARNCGCSRV